MKKPMLKFAFAAAFAGGALAVNAQEFGDGVVPVAVEPSAPTAAETQPFAQDPNGALAQDMEYIAPAKLAAPIEPAEIKARPIETLNQVMSDDGILPYDPQTERIAVAAAVTFDVRNPKVSTDFIQERSARMMELIMNGKAEIIKTVCSRMSAERLLSMPANPIRKRLAEQENEIRRQIEYTESLLAEAGVKLADAKNGTQSLSIPELMAAIADVFNSDYAAKLDAEKKAEFEAAQQDYAKLKKEYDALVEQAKVFQAKFKDAVQKQTSADISLTAEMQISGCTILEQAEGSWFDADSKTWKYQIAAIFTWSREHQDAAKAILSGAGAKFESRKHSVTAWLDHYADVDPKLGGLCDWMGPRTYIDDHGDLWYLGIYATPVLPNAIANEKARKSAALMARAEVGFALLSDVVTTNAYEMLQLDVDVDGQTVSKKLEDYSEKTRESFQNLTIFGLGKIREYERKHATGNAINIVVCGVNASNAQAMRDIQRLAKNTALEINTMQQEELGHQRRIRQQIEASRDNAAARRAGAARADGETREDIERAARAKVQEAADAAAEETPVETPAPTGLKRSTRFTRSTDDF